MSLKKKILFITHSYAMTGGAEDEFERLLKFFSEKSDSYEVHGLFPEGPRVTNYSSYCTRWGTYKYGHLPVIYESLFGYIKYLLKSVIQVFQIIRFAKGQKYDLAAINVVVLIWPALAMKFMGTKVIVFIREDIFPIKLRHLVYKILSKTCSFFIPNSITKERDFVQTTNDFRVKHIYPGIEDEVENRNPKLKVILNQEQYSKVIEKNKFKFISPARILKKKNQLLTLKALNNIRLSQTNEMPYIFFVGYYDISSTYMKTLIEYIQQHSISRYCFFLGELDRSVLYELYYFIDATLVTSLSEGMPIVLVESFKFQKPVISTKVGGIPEVIEDSVNGFLVDFDDKQLSNTMMELMNDHNLYEAIRTKALLTYTENFNLNKILNETEDIFNKISKNEINIKHNSLH